MTDQPQGTEPAGDERPTSACAGASGASFYGRRGAMSPSEALQPEAAPPPPEKKRKRSRLGAASGFLSFLLAAAFLVGVGVVFADRAARAPGPLPADKVVYIQQGSDSDQIIDELQTQGVIDSPMLFRMALLFEGARSRMKAGEYLFKQGASVQDVINTMVSGKAILHSITIPEGLTSEQVVDRLRQDDLLIGDIREIPREGSLLPETYKFHRGDRRDKLLQKMAGDEKQLVAAIWRSRAPDLPLTSPYELVTLASIVEKETGKPDERPRVAAVFLNRLRKHMRLQSDPTIIYGLVGGKGALGRPLTHADVESQTAYNTYVIDGLPPGPIANPGRAALEAVANPARTKDLYFVADGTGGHVFSDSLGAHNRNVQRWRQIEQNKTTSPSAPAGAAAPAGRDEHSENAPGPAFGAAHIPSEFVAQARKFYRVADGAGGHVFSDLRDADDRAAGRWRRIDRKFKAEAQLVAGAPASRDDYGATAPQQGFGVPPIQPEFAARREVPGPRPIAKPGAAARATDSNPAHAHDLYFVAEGAGGHVPSNLRDANDRDAGRGRRIDRKYKAEAQVAAGAPADRSAKAFDFGAPPSATEFAARHDLAPPRPRLRPDPRMIARVAPLMPWAPPPPRRLADFDPDRAGVPDAPKLAALGDIEMGGITRAENELDGPADEMGTDPAIAQASPPQPRAVASDLDGAAEPVQTDAIGSGAMSYAGGIVNAAPNGKPRIYDAVAGTALDPLLEKNWDLNSAQTVDVPQPQTETAVAGSKTRSLSKSRPAHRSKSMAASAPRSRSKTTSASASSK